MNQKARGNLIIVAAPSGGGKTSLVKSLVATVSATNVSISHTTRCARPGEEDGSAYFFVDEKTFLQMVDEDEFIEYAIVFNHYYGTSKAQVNAHLDAGVDVILDIDWQGAAQIRRVFPDAISVFIIPPSLNVLKERLFARSQDNIEVICARMQQAKEELSHFSEFDYLIINSDFKEASRDLQVIVLANRLKMVRQSKEQGKLLSFLLASK